MADWEQLADWEKFCLDVVDKLNAEFSVVMSDKMALEQTQLQLIQQIKDLTERNDWLQAELMAKSRDAKKYAKIQEILRKDKEREDQEREDAVLGSNEFYVD